MAVAMTRAECAVQGGVYVPTTSSDAIVVVGQKGDVSIVRAGKETVSASKVENLPREDWSSQEFIKWCTATVRDDAVSFEKMGWSFRQRKAYNIALDTYKSQLVNSYPASKGLSDENASRIVQMLGCAQKGAGDDEGNQRKVAEIVAVEAEKFSIDEGPFAFIASRGEPLGASGENAKMMTSIAKIAQVAAEAIQERDKQSVIANEQEALKDRPLISSRRMRVHSKKEDVRRQEMRDKSQETSQHETPRRKARQFRLSHVRRLLTEVTPEGDDVAMWGSEVPRRLGSITTKAMQERGKQSVIADEQEVLRGRPPISSGRKKVHWKEEDLKRQAIEDLRRLEKQIEALRMEAREKETSSQHQRPRRKARLSSSAFFMRPPNTTPSTFTREEPAAIKSYRLGEKNSIDSDFDVGSDSEDSDCDEGSRGVPAAATGVPRLRSRTDKTSEATTSWPERVEEVKALSRPRSSDSQAGVQVSVI